MLYPEWLWQNRPVKAEWKVVVVLYFLLCHVTAQHTNTWSTHNANGPVDFIYWGLKIMKLSRLWWPLVALARCFGKGIKCIFVYPRRYTMGLHNCAPEGLRCQWILAVSVLVLMIWLYLLDKDKTLHSIASARSLLKLHWEVTVMLKC